MRCPKCHYVSFDGQSRCRNCGYDLTLPPSEPFDLSTRPGNPTATPLADLSLKPDPPSGGGVVPDTFAPARDSGSGSGATGPAGGGGTSGAVRGRSSADADPLDLPLFDPGPSTGPGSAPGSPGSLAGRAAADLDRPLISPSSPPRPPLAVRRPTGDVPRARPRVTPGAPPSSPRFEEPRLDLDEPDRLPDAADRLHMERPAPRGGGSDRLSPGATGADRAPGGIDRTGAPLPADRGAADRGAGDRGRMGIDPTRATPDRARSTPTPDPPAVAGGVGAGVAGAGGTGARTGLGSGPGVDDNIEAGEGAGHGGGARASHPIARPERPRAGGLAFPDDEMLIADDGPAAREGRAEDVDASNAAPLGARAIAALLDLAFLVAVDFAVLHFTLRLTGLSLDGANRLPLAPLFGFLALLNGGYLTMFIAASGQTMGKMVTGVQVVSMRGGAVPFGNAVLRAILWLLTIVPLGVGAIPALLTDDRRALHDRLADTRVIKID